MKDIENLIYEYEENKRLLQKLKIQISIYSGRKLGGLSTLQDMYHKLKDNDKIVCESCGNRIDKGGRHNQNCEIVKNYIKIMYES